jgi:hypothetical protein
MYAAPHAAYADLQEKSNPTPTAPESSSIRLPAHIERQVQQRDFPPFAWFFGPSHFTEYVYVCRQTLEVKPAETNRVNMIL